MATDQKPKLKIISVLDAGFCVKSKCRFAYIADVLMASGRQTRMLYCSRLDCDNWSSAKIPT
jgi:hypothetical protein